MNELRDKNKPGQVDLVRDPILPALTRLASPIIASAFLSTFYNLTDMAWVGTLGANAVAAIGIGGMFIWFSKGVIMIARMGSQVLTAQSIGRGDRGEAALYARGGVILALLLSLIYGGICGFGTSRLVGFFGLNSEESFRQAVSYLRIVCGLIVFFFMSLTLTGLFNAQGDSKTPFLANLTGLGINMVLDPVLIHGIGPFPRLGVTGAATATVFAQAIVTGMILWKLFRSDPDHNVLRLREAPRPADSPLGNASAQPDAAPAGSTSSGGEASSSGDASAGPDVAPVPLIPDAAHFIDIVRIGLPAALQNMLYTTISMILGRIVITWGDGAIAAQRMGAQVEALCYNIADGISSAVNAFVAQNYGAKRKDRIIGGFRAGAGILALWALLMEGFFYFCSMPISGIFFHEPVVTGLASDYMKIISFGEVPMCIEFVTVGALSGLGKTGLCSIITISLTVIRIPLAILLSSTSLGLNGVWWALTLTSCLKGAVFLATFWYQTRKL